MVRLLWIEAVFAVAYENWIGAGYLGGMAGELGLKLSLVSVIAAIPWIGAGGQILGLWLSARSPSVKSYVLGMAALGRGVWLVPAGLAAAWGVRSHVAGVRFPTAPWFGITAVCACLSSLLTAASGNAWMVWMRNLIPHSFLGRFFGCRQRHMTGAFIGASLVAAALVGWRPHGYWIGFGLMSILALGAGTISLRLQSRVRDVPWERDGTREKPSRSFRQQVMEPIRDPGFRRLLVFGAAFHGSVQLSASYFPYYFTHQLGVSMGVLAIWAALANVGCFLSARAWGTLADRHEHPLSILWRVGHLAVFSPLVYLLADGRNVLWIAPIEQFFNGLVWTGFTLIQTKLLMRSIPRGKGTAYFSVFAAAIGAGGAVSTFLGGRLAEVLAPWGGIKGVWVVSALLRLGVLWLLCRPLVEQAQRKVVSHAMVVDAHRALIGRVARSGLRRRGPFGSYRTPPG